MSDFRGPGIQGVTQSDQPDAQHDDRPAANAVGQHAERPDQQQGDDFRHPRELPGNGPGDILISNPEVLGEDVGLGEVHVRHHPDADQRCVHVGPEVGDAHSRRELDPPYARAGAAINVGHRKVVVFRWIRNCAQPRRMPASSRPAQPPRWLWPPRSARPARRLSAGTAPRALPR